MNLESDGVVFGSCGSNHASSTGVSVAFVDSSSSADCSIRPPVKDFPHVKPVDRRSPKSNRRFFRLLRASLDLGISGLR